MADVSRKPSNHSGEAALSLLSKTAKDAAQARRLEFTPDTNTGIEPGEKILDQFGVEITEMNAVKPHFDKRPSISDLLAKNRQCRSATVQKQYSFMTKERVAPFGRFSRWKTEGLNPSERFTLLAFIIPLLVSLWYCVACLFPPGAREVAPILLWTESFLGMSVEGKYTLGCPPPPVADTDGSYQYEGGRWTICSEGILQIAMIILARISAFACYVPMGLTFVSKMHSTIHFFSNTYVATWVPFESFHDFHIFSGKIYANLIILHAISHLIRWCVRNEFGRGFSSQVGLSGIIGTVAICMCVFFMVPWGKKLNKLPFEWRFFGHWISFLILSVVLCFHAERLRKISLIFFGLWSLDYAYGIVKRTYRLEVVEFSALPNGVGTQILWRNPEGFQPKSGEFVKIMIPWLSAGQKNEWHPFSLYLQEQTKEGLAWLEKSRPKDSAKVLDLLKEEEYSYCSFKDLNPQTTALILIDWQNKFVSPDGKLYSFVKEVMEHNACLPKMIDVVKACRDAGVYIIHAPMNLSSNEYENGNRSSFIKNEWGSEIVDDLKPHLTDGFLKNKKKRDSFDGTNLEDLLRKKGITTVFLSGFLTNYAVASTMRSASEKGFKVYTLSDGTACNSLKEQFSSVEGSLNLFSNPITCEELTEFLNTSLDEIDLESAMDFSQGSLRECIESNLASAVDDSMHISTLVRQDLRNRYNTTQIFATAAGDWSKELAGVVAERTTKRSCWVRGPFTSPYFIASDFCNIILMASGIGITPALGVIGQYPGGTRTKILIWSVRCKIMLKFFIPLIKGDNSLFCSIFYTGKDKLNEYEFKDICSIGNVYVQQSRCENLVELISECVVIYEKHFSKDKGIECLDDVSDRLRATWVTLYCGGSTRIRDELAKFTKESGIGYECELFDW